MNSIGRTGERRVALPGPPDDWGGRLPPPASPIQYHVAFCNTVDGITRRFVVFNAPIVAGLQLPTPE
jgi:hypothetical protein